MQVTLILVVDANARLGHVIKEFIEDESRTLVHVVRSGADALRFVQQVRPNLILLDVSHATPDSLDLCRKLKEDPRTRTIPVVVFSPTGSRRVAFAAGCSDYVRVPFGPDQLADVVRRWL